MNRLLAWSLIAVAGVVAAPAAAHAAPRLYSIAEFNAAQANLRGVEIRVEGRVSTYGNNIIRFRHCDKVLFRTPEGLLASLKGVKNVEVTGTLTREDGRTEFQVTSVRQLPTDLETFQKRRREVRLDSPEQWSELGEWARRRAAFYDNDPDLLARGEEALLRAIEIRRRNAARTAPEQFLQLAADVRKLNLPETLYRSLVHEAYWLRWELTQKKTGAVLEALASDIEHDLPGSAEPLRAPDAALRKKYLANPLKIYDVADEPERRALHRMLYSEVVLRQISSRLASDAGNGFEMADLLEQRLPEQRALAESWRDRALAGRAAEVDTLPRKEMLALAEQYRTRNQPRQADQIIESWLTLRRRKLQADDIEGLLQLTDEYRTLLKRDDVADRILFEVYEANPGATETAERLERRGYRLKDGRWITAEEFNTRPEGMLERALREGRVEVGMTGAQVRKSVGEPLVIAKAATAGLVTEIWIYGQGNAARLVIRLAKRATQRDLAVVSLDNVLAH